MRTVPVFFAFTAALAALWPSPNAFADEPGDPQAQPSAIPGAGAGSGTGLMNPDLSLNGLFALGLFNRAAPLVFDAGHDPKQNGFNLQQIELTLGASVDPYFRSDANLVLTDEGEVEVEEAYASSLDLPWDLQLKAGTFFTAFGRQNPTHPHSWDWADKPLVLGRFFGGDGLRNPGAQLSWLAPLPWYSELVASLQNSNGETAVSFLGEGGKMRTLGDGLALARWLNFFPIGEALSVSAGASFAEGKNSQGPGARTRIVGGDLYVKYRKPEGLSYLALTVEFLQRYYDLSEGQARDWGWYAQLDYRLPAGFERWHAGLRFDQVGDRNAPVETSRPVVDGEPSDVSRRFRVSPVITFYPSEFSKVRFQYDYDSPRDFAHAQQVGIVQLEFLMGAHGAHKF